MDRRLTPTNGRVAEIGWEDRVSADRFVKGDWQTVRSSFVDLCREPGGARDRQLLHGDRFLTLETLDGWSFGRSGKDGYVGYISAAALGSDIAPTHVVTARATHFYADPRIQSRNVMALGFGSKLSLVDEIDAFFATSDGLFVPKVHVGGIEHPAG